MEITNSSISDFIAELDDKRKLDIEVLIELFERLSQSKPQLWGSIVGFGSLHYVYASKREGDMPLIGLANRKAAITLYLSDTISSYPELEYLGKHKVSKACLYINKLEDINIEVLEQIVIKSIKETLSLDYISINK